MGLASRVCKPIELNLNPIYCPPLQSHPKYQYVGSRSGVYGHSHVETGCRNSTDGMEEVSLTALDPSSVQIVYRMRGISDSGVHVPNWTLLRSTWCRGGCVSGLAHSAGQCTILLKMPQQVTSGLMIGRRRQIYGHFGYERLVRLRYREILPKFITND